MAAMAAAAVALNEAVAAPAATATVPGAVRSGLLLASVMLVPPGGAAFVNVTVQLAVAPAFRLAGAQVTEDIVGTVMIEPPPAATARPVPVALTPIALVNASAMVAALGASVT